MWEVRHNALHPHRSVGNTRYYDNQQLRRLLNIVSLQENGKKISELSAMSDPELSELLKDQTQIHFSGSEVSDKGFYISQLLAAGMGYDAGYFEKFLAHCLLRFGIDTTYTEVVYPMLMRIGLLWSVNELPPAQEHFISNLLRQKLYTAIDSLPPPPVNAPGWLLFLPEDEFHEIGLLMADYLLRRNGQKTLYLGANVPLSSLASAAEEWKADNLLFFMVHRDSPENILKYLQGLQETFPEKQLLLACDRQLLREVNPPPGMQLLHTLPGLVQLVKDQPQIFQAHV